MAGFLIWPDGRLREAAAPANVAEAGPVWEALLGLMYGAHGLVGLAAPQIGEGVALAVVDCSESRDEAVRIANPELLSVSEETATSREASPNLPGQWAEVERPSACRIRFQDETGASVERGFEGLWARSVLHQLDHLEGRMFFDRIGPMRRQRLLEAHRKAARKRARG